MEDWAGGGCGGWIWCGNPALTLLLLLLLLLLMGGDGEKCGLVIVVVILAILIITVDFLECTEQLNFPTDH